MELNNATNFAKACKKFKKFFGVNLQKFVINFGTLEFFFAIVEFDEYLQKEFKEEYLEDESMSEFILRKFGKEAHEFIKQLI